MMGAFARLAPAAFLLGAACAHAEPRLTPGVFPLDGGAVSMKVLANATDVPPPTPSFRIRTTRSGGQTKTEKVYDDPNAPFFASEILGIWRDSSGNIMRVAKPDRYPWGKGVEYKTERVLPNGTKYYVEFEFAEKVKPSVAKQLLRSAASSMTTLRNSATTNSSAMKWWEQSSQEYRFITDLGRTKGGQFITDSLRELSAMRRLYEQYVPPTNAVGVCKVRVFSKDAGYREYRMSTGSEDSMSCGLWDPGREELLVLAEKPDQARRTMRHEGFHQYLYFAVPGRHAIWFNEGHATFFEEVKLSGDRKTAKVVEEGNRKSWVARDPARHAREIPRILRMSQQEFYSGEVNLHYCTAWAFTYFLEKGAYSDARFEPYRKVLPTYLELVASGMDGLEATAKAMEPLSGRDVSEDFLAFWNSPRFRKAAQRER